MNHDQEKTKVKCLTTKVLPEASFVEISLIYLLALSSILLLNLLSQSDVFSSAHLLPYVLKKIFFCNPHLRTCLLILEREGRGGGERGRETSM